MSVIVISMVLVVFGFVTLMLGVLGVGEDPLQFVYVSIAACLVAAVFLVIGVVRGRPSKKPVAASGGEGRDASWAGASAWGDKDADQQGTAAMEREEAPSARTGGPTHVQVVTAEEAAGGGGGDEEFQPPTEGRPAQAAAAEDRDEPVIVPKRSAAARAAAGPEGDATEQAAPRKAAAKRGTAKKAAAKKAAAKKGAAKKAAAKKGAAKKGAAKKGAAKKGAAKKGAAKKGTAKKSTGRKKATAKKAAEPSAARTDAARAEEKLSDVPGVGPAKRRALLDHFGSFDALSSASSTKLQEVEGVSQTLADRIRRALR